MAKLFIITDKNVHRLYKKQFLDAETIVIGTGEKIKDLGTVQYICKELLKRGADRTSFLLGVGGGVVCDITGLTASIFMRGVDFGFVPTTLLAQVDASIGGKSGVNFDGFKNMIGTIRQPKFILHDTRFIKTLSDREYKSGVAEVIKHAIIKDPSLFRYLELHKREVMSRKKSAVERIVRESKKIKTNIVKKDEFDKGLRRILNFGHTYGHALEAVAKGRVSHGEAVSIGMAFATRLSFLRGYIKRKDAQRIEKLIRLYGLPVVVDAKKVNINTLISAIEKDKKKDSRGINFVFVKGIGSAFTGRL